MKKTLAVTLLVALSSVAIANDTQVFNWKTSKGGNAYSDTPNKMQMGRSNVLNIRTGTVTPPTTPAAASAPMSIADQQAQLNQRIAEENKRAEEENKKREAETKAENCKTAQMNRANAERARNKAELIPKYDSMVAKFCN